MNRARTTDEADPETLGPSDADAPDVHTPKGPERPETPPPYDPSAVGRLAKRVQIMSVDLLGAHFDREDDAIIPTAPVEFTPEIGIAAEWELSEDDGTLGCVFTFSTLPEDGPFQVVARFRLLYALREGEPSDEEEDVAQFVYWNAVFNAWPYWREYVSSTINRAHLLPYMVPVMGVPMPKRQTEPT